MNLDDLMRQVGHLPWFDLATLVQLSGERRESLTNQLYRLSRAGRVLPLRRGLYTLAESHRKVPVQPAALANAIYRPSYLSCEWALSYHGIIPEAVMVYTSVTSRVPRRFVNAFGEFVFRNVKQEIFGGYHAVVMSGASVLVAGPEKALFDYLHLSKGEWTSDRWREMRVSVDDNFDLAKLTSLASREGSPRVRRAVSRLAQVQAVEEEGVVL